MKIRSRPLNFVAAALMGFGMRLLFRTCRLESVTSGPGVSPYGEPTDRRFLYSIWHEHLAACICVRPSRHVAGIVSPHRDGDYVADVMKLFGLFPIRGSSNRRGAIALIKAIREAAGWHIAITPDGPRGPRRTIAPGIAFLAAKTGRAIVPVSVVPRHPWVFRGNWTDLVLARPFTTVRLVGGPPIEVPPSLPKEELDGVLARLADAMDLTEKVARGEITPEEAWGHGSHEETAAHESDFAQAA